MMDVTSSLLSNPATESSNPTTERVVPERSCWNKFMGNTKDCYEVSVQGMKDCHEVSMQTARDCWRVCKLWFREVIGCCGLSFWTLIGCCGLGSVLKRCCSPRLPLSKKWSLPKMALADFLDSVATTSVTGILTLSIFLATFFVSWEPKAIDCLPRIALTGDTKPEVEKWVKVIAVGLPFILFPVTLYLAGQAKALQRDPRGIGLVAGGVLLEISYMLCIGTMMMVCTSGSKFILAAKVIGSFLPLLLIGWGCCCFYPKCLRSLLRCICCWGCTCQQVDDIEAPAPVPPPAPAPSLPPAEQAQQCLTSFLRCICCWGCTCQQIEDIEALARASSLPPADQAQQHPPHAHMS